MSLAMIADSRESGDRDRGAVLLLVLAVAIVLSLVMLALANFVAADLRYAQIVDGTAVRLASAEGGIDYAVDRLQLNQTLCATDVATGGPVRLNGSNSIPVGTPLPQTLNGTTTTVTCQRLDDGIADVAGWAVVIANYGESPPSDQIQVDMNDTAIIDGPVFLPDAVQTDTDSNSRVAVVDGDLWYTRSNCNTPYSNTALAAEHIDISPASARGGICTTEHSGPLFSVPEIQDALPTNIAPDINSPTGKADGDSTSFPGCRVFSPGRYDLVPDLTNLTGVPGVTDVTDVYFKSGDYHFNFDIEWQIAGVDVWAGYPDPGSVGTLGPCNAAAAADLAQVGGFYGGRPGATFYFDRNSRLRVEHNGAIEMFPRQQGANDEYSVSVQALPGSTTGNSTSLIRTRPDGGDQVQLVIHGLVWAPDGRFAFDNEANGSVQKLLGGIVAQRLWILRVDTSGTPPRFQIKPASSAVDTRILLTSTSTLNGLSTTVEAVVEYRPQTDDLTQRVAVTSFRVVD